MKCVILVFSLLLMDVLLTSCDNDDNVQLPPATQIGANTFGCLVDGKAWVPKGYAGYSNLDVSYDPTSYGGSFDIATYRILSDPNREYIYIYTSNCTAPGIFALDDPLVGAATYSYSNGCKYDRDATVYRTGTLNITKLDLVNRIASGTFEFTLFMQGCDTLKITKGRFDITI